MSKHQDEDSDSVQSAVCHAVCCAGSGDPGKTVIVGSLLCVMLYAVLAEERSDDTQVTLKLYYKRVWYISDLAGL